MKKYSKFLLFAVLMVMFSLFTVQQTLAQTAGFSDVDETHPNYQAVNFLKEKGIVEGYLVEGNVRLFKPDNPIIRAEALKMILESQGVADEQVSSDSVFSDIKTDDWFYKYVMKAFGLKIVKGYDDGSFKPAKNVSLVEAMKMLFEAGKVDYSAYVGQETNFVDVPKDAWFAPYVNYARDKHIVVGLYDGTFDPNRLITRGQLAEIIYRLDAVNVNNGSPFDITQNWLSFVHPSENYQVSYPRDWEVKNYNDLTVFWRDLGNESERFFTQESALSTYLAIYQDRNLEQLSLDDYFAAKKANLPNGSAVEGVLSDLNYLKILDIDKNSKWFFYLPNKQVLVVYTNMKDDTSFRYRLAIQAMIDSVKYVKRDVSPDQVTTDVLSVVRENILVEGKGKMMVDLLGDAKIIETDTIGVGTGPVDYYYSTKFDVTLKYERSADLLLDVQKGQTTEF